MVSLTYQGPCYSLWDGMPLFSPMWPQCWPSTIEQGWLTPDHYLTSFKIFIRMACTGLHVESFSTLSPWFICSDFHLPSYKNLCLHWNEKMMGGQESPIFSGDWHLNKSLSFFTGTCLTSLAFLMAGSQTLIWLYKESGSRFHLFIEGTSVTVQRGMNIERHNSLGAIFNILPHQPWTYSHRILFLFHW